jgi:hypothetical protein
MAWAEHRTPWNDKFTRPAPEALGAVYPAAIQDLLRDVRAGLGALSGLEASLDWQGVPWRWTFVYRGTGDLAEHATPASGGPTPVNSPSGLSLLRAFAYVVPDPARLQVCIPLTGAQIEALPAKKIKRPVKDVIAAAGSVAGVWWPTWELTGPGVLEDVLDLAARKHRFLLTAAGVAPA